MLTKYYLQPTDKMVRDQVWMPMGMLYAPIVKLESIVGLQDLPILRKTTVEQRPAVLHSECNGVLKCKKVGCETQWVSINVPQVNPYNSLIF